MPQESLERGERHSGVYKRVIATAQGAETLEVGVLCPRCHVMAFAEDGDGAAWGLRPAAPEPPRESDSADQAGPLLFPEDTLVGAVMSRNVICVQADVSAQAIRNIFIEKNIGCAPVLDGGDNLIGLVSKTDLLRDSFGELSDDNRPLAVRTRSGWTYVLDGGFHLEADASTTVGEIMTPGVVSLPETATLRQATELMTFHHVHRLVVLAAAGEIVGLLSAMDIVAWVARGGRVPLFR